MDYDVKIVVFVLFNSSEKKRWCVELNWRVVLSSYVPPTRRRRESTRDDDGGGWICRYVLDTGNNNKGRTGEESKDKLVRRIQVAQQQRQQQQQQRPIDPKSTTPWLAGWWVVGLLLVVIICTATAETIFLGIGRLSSVARLHFGPYVPANQVAYKGSCIFWNMKLKSPSLLQFLNLHKLLLNFLVGSSVLLFEI